MASAGTCFQFHDKFFGKDCLLLDEKEKAKLYAFLDKLLSNPDSPAYVERQDGYYAEEFSPGRVVCWKLIRTDRGTVIRVLEIVFYKSNW